MLKEIIVSIIRDEVDKDAISGMSSNVLPYIQLLCLLTGQSSLRECGPSIKTIKCWDKIAKRMFVPLMAHYNNKLDLDGVVQELSEMIRVELFNQNDTASDTTPSFLRGLIITHSHPHYEPTTTSSPSPSSNTSLLQSLQSTHLDREQLYASLDALPFEYA